MKTSGRFLNSDDLLSLTNQAQRAYNGLLRYVRDISKNRGGWFDLKASSARRLIAVEFYFYVLAIYTGLFFWSFQEVTVSDFYS